MAENSNREWSSFQVAEQNERYRDDKREDRAKVALSAIV